MNSSRNAYAYNVGTSRRVTVVDTAGIGTPSVDGWGTPGIGASGGPRPGLGSGCGVVPRRTDQCRQVMPRMVGGGGHTAPSPSSVPMTGPGGRPKGRPPGPGGQDLRRRPDGFPGSSPISSPMSSVLTSPVLASPGTTSSTGSTSTTSTTSTGSAVAPSGLVVPNALASAVPRPSRTGSPVVVPGVDSAPGTVCGCSVTLPAVNT